MLKAEPGAAEAAAPTTPTDLDEIAVLLLNASGAMLCVIAWESGASRGMASAPANCGDWAEAARSVLGALAQRMQLPRDRSSYFRFSLVSSELAAILNGHAASAAAVMHSSRAACVRVVIIAPIGRPTSELESLAELGCRATVALLAKEEHEAAHAFWLRRGADAALEHSRVCAELDDYRSRARAVAELDERTRALRVRDRFIEFGKLAASTIRCDKWMLSLIGPDGGRESIASNSEAPGIWCGSIPEKANSDRTQPNGLSALVRFESGSIALSAREPISERERRRLVEFVAACAPLLESWRMELALENERTLVQRMAYRMFHAVDDERARIARDLHDDHAQLITATRLALSGGGAEARAMVERIEGELRRRIRELKPASLGRISLPHALSIEAARLKQAGIEMTTSGISQASAISRAAQNLCWLFAREAISNAILHSHASRLEVAISRSPLGVAISVTDDGIGMKHSSDGDGTGLAGIRERLTLMGGDIKIRSRPGKTVLRAQIPDPL